MSKVDVISAETIKPSSPTPHHLHSFKLSLLDQLSPRIYIPLLLFYPTKDTDHVLHQLKRSLSETLTFFYPLAGRIKEDDTIDCNDEGVDLFNARVNGLLSEFLKQPNVEVLDQLLPGDLFCTRSGVDVLLAIQVNVFDCGGVAIGVRLSHKIADGSGLVTFISKWGALARAIPMDGRLVSASSLFPPTSSVPSFMYAIGENFVTKRLVFDAASIATLRAKASDPKIALHPTRVEAVSALIWRCIMRAFRNEQSASATVSVAKHVVNLRERMAPPVPNSYLGNFWVGVVTKGAMINECNEGILEMQLRDAIRAVDSDFIKELQGLDGAVKARENMKNVSEKYLDYGIHVCRFSSWLRFPYYDVDFGWGKPIWISVCSIPIQNGVLFMGTRCGDGMEVWLNMEADEMAKFEHDQELNSFISIT